LDRPSAAFELLLNSPLDVQVLARPLWWTLRRLLILVGALACVLVIAGLWITLLHRKVEQRTAQLEAQIQKRQRLEKDQAMGLERARIAKDLHDDLGSGLVEIKMLATLPAATPGSQPPLDEISDRAKQMVLALDEIVWAMNPKHDSLESLASYLCLYADRFLKPAGIACHVRVPLDLPSHALNSIHRHEFYLAFKEALTNVVRHSQAAEVRLSLALVGTRLRLALTDNGAGLPPARPASDMDGLANMRARLEKIGGRFAITSLPGRGTTVRFYMPLN
jgi:signal transduction histidine kinase